jgi:hypothetical protein
MAARSLPRKIVVLAAGLMIAGGLAAPSPVTAAYTGRCVDAGWFNFSFQHINLRDHTERFTGAIMDVTAQMLVPCTYSTGVGSGTLINATLQRGPNHPIDLAQIGIVRCSRQFGCGGDGGGGADAGGIPGDGALHFWYTKHDAGGFLYLADGWYGGPPVIGHRYRLKVEAVGTNSWGYYIRDLTAGEPYVIKYRERTWDSANEAWWGGEAYNTNDAMGNRHPLSPDLNIRSEYRREGLWYQTDGSDQNCMEQYPSDPEYQAAFPNGLPGYWKCKYTTVTLPDDRQQIRTTDHH